MNGAKKEEHRTGAQLLEDNEELRRRLEEAEQMLDAIRSGDVDALVVAGAQGEQVFTLTGAEHVYRVIVETMNEAALTVDPDGTILFSNQRFCDLMKTAMHGVLGRKVTTFAARPQQPSLGELMIEAQTAPAQRRITLRAADGTAVPVQMSASLLTTNGSTSICLVATDLTELEASARSVRVLREHEQALEESESRFRTIFEATQDAIVIADDEGTYVQANPAVQAIFGLPPEQLIGHHLSEFVGGHIDVPVVWRNFRATGSFHGEMPLTGADGQARYVDAYAVANILPGRHLCVVRDVTERRRAEEALKNANEQLQAQAEELQAQAEELRATNDDLRLNEQALQEAEERLHLAMEAGRVGVWEWEVGTERVKWSQGIYRLLGCKPGEVTLSHEGFRQRIHPQDRQRQAQALRESMERCEDYSCEFRVVWMDGSVHWVEDRGQYVYLDDGNGTILWLRGVLSDIDARKQSEEALHSVALFPEENPWPVLRVARDGTLLFANGASAPLLRSWDCRAGQAAPEQIRRYVVQALDSREIVEADVVCGPITYSFAIAPIASEGYANLYARDITERKRAEEALRESEQRNRRLIDNLKGSHFIYVHDTQGVFNYVSESLTDILGYTPDEFMAHYSTYLTDHPVNEAVHRHTELSIQGIRQPPYEVNAWHKDGSSRWLEVQEVPVFDAAGKVIAVEGVAQDITERKRAEGALRESRERLERAQEIAHLGSWELDLVNDRLTWSDEVYRIFGLAPREFGATYEAFLDRVHPEDRAAVDAAYTGSLREDRDTYEIEHRVVRRDTGETRFVHEKCEHFRDDTGRIVRSVGMVHDITERKRAEEALRESEERYHRLFEDDLTGNFISTPEGKILLCNPAFARTFGFAHAQEAMGTSLVDLYVDPKERESRLERLRQEGKIERLETWRKRRDGMPIYVVENLVGHFNERGELYEIKGYVFDDTERKRAEEARRRERSLLDSVMRATDVMLVFLDPQFNFVWVNPAYAETCRRKPEEMVGKNHFDLYPDAENEAIFRKVRDTGEGVFYKDKPFTFPDQPDRGVTYWDWSLTPTKDADGKVTGLVFSLRETTSFKQAQEALQKSEEKFAKAFRSSPIAVAVTRLSDGRILDVNEAMLKLLHFHRDEVIGHTTLDLGVWVDTNDRAQFIQKISVAGAVRDLEYRLRTQDGEIVTVHLSAELLEFSGELCMLSTLVDTTERKHAEEALRERMKELACLHAVRRDIQEDLSIDELCRRAVEHLVSALQFPEITVAVVELNGKRFTSKTYTEGLSHGLHAEIIVEGDVLGHLKVYYTQERPFVIPEEQNLVNGVAEALSTWLERKRAEEALRESEQRYHRLFEDDLTGNFICTPEGQILLCNPSFARTFGFARPQEAVGTSMRDLYLDPQEREALLERLKQQGKIDRFEVWRKRRDGEPIYIVENLVGRFNEQGELYEIKGYVFDDTERKHAEEALRESEQRYRTVGETIPYGVWLTDASGYCTYVSDSFLELVGMTMEEVQQFDWLHLLPPTDVEPTREHWLRCVATGAPFEREHRFRTKEGGYRHVLAIGRPIRDEHGQIISWAGINLDITERKQAEEALRESEERLRLAQQAARIGTFEWNIRTGVDRWTPELEAVYGLAPGGFAGTEEAWEQLVHPEDREEARRRVVRALETGVPAEGEWRVVWPDGSVHWVAGRWQVFRDESGAPLRMTGINIDITERKWAEEAVRESEERLRQAAQAAHFGVYDADLVADRLYCSPEMREILGLPADVPIHPTRDRVPSLVHPDDAGQLQQALDAAYDPAGTGVLEDEHRVIRPDGTVRWIMIKGQVQFDGQDTDRRPVRSSGIILDINDRKQGEQALRRSEERLRQRVEEVEKLMEVAPVAIWVSYDPQCNQILGNRAANSFYEANGQENVSANVSPVRRFFRNGQELKPEELPMQEATARNADVRNSELDALLPSGRWLNMLGSASPLRDAEGHVRGCVGAFMDITERKRAEQQLRELTRTLENKVARRTAELEHRARQLQKLTLELSLAEDRERKNLAEVLHDDLQQQLAAAKFHLQMLGSRLRHDPPKQAIVTKVDQMLKDAIEKSRSLSHELSPAVLYHGNLVETFNWLAGQIQEKHGLIVHVDAFNEVTVRSDALKAFLYKAAQELLFNVVKHARVNEARIRLRRIGRCVCVSVSDHGRGFDPQELRETTGFGLFSIRERIGLLGGRMKIKSAKGQGSTFHIIVPDDGAALGSLPSLLATSQRRATSGERPATSDAPPALRVLLADDHEIVREGLASLLAEVPGIEVVGAAANGREAINLASKLRPDVVVMDVAMPLINGDEATRQIKLHLPGTRVVALSMYDDVDLIEKMRLAGAEGYVLKTAPSEELLAAIRGQQSRPCDNGPDRRDPVIPAHSPPRAQSNG